ncbi:MAG: alpha/beta hydrolase [Planctomycetaceae bacterium]|nr:alpha/beta hydrolase [Planctomycetaceae bacterium]
MTRLRQLLMCFCGLLLTVAGPSAASGQTAQSKQPAAQPVRKFSLVYRTEPDRGLTVYCPDDWQPTDRRPALVIFRCNIPEQREHFRKLGMVIIKPVLANVNHGRLPGSTLEEIRQLPKPRHQVEDTKTAIRFIRQNAGRLGIDPEKIVATGTSGGGDLSLQASINRAFENPRDDRTVSPRPDALILYCPAFDGIDIWYVTTKVVLDRTRKGAPSFLPLLPRFIENTTDEYATPVNHRADLIQLAADLGKEQNIDEGEISNFQNVLRLFNKSDWQLLNPVEDELKMAATRILDDEPFPPTLIMYGDRDHLYQHQQAFVAAARKRGKKFDLKILAGAGHSFMMGPPFQEPSTAEAEQFLRRQKFLPVEQN